MRTGSFEISEHRVDRRLRPLHRLDDVIDEGDLEGLEGATTRDARGTALEVAAGFVELEEAGLFAYEATPCHAIERAKGSAPARQGVRGLHGHAPKLGLS